MKPSKPTRKAIDAVLDDVRAERHDLEDAHTKGTAPLPHLYAAQGDAVEAVRALQEWPSLPDGAEARALLIEAMAHLVIAIEAIDRQVASHG